MEASHSVGLQLQEAWRNDAILEIDGLSTDVSSLVEDISSII